MIDPLYVAAREVLFEALEGLGAQRHALVLAGAQAIYIHTGSANLAVAEFTTDSDIVIDPSLLKSDPKLAEAMGRAQFRLGVQPGIWLRDRVVSGIPTVIPWICWYLKPSLAMGIAPHRLAITAVEPGGLCGASRELSSTAR